VAEPLTAAGADVADRAEDMENTDTDRMAVVGCSEIECNTAEVGE